LRFPVLSFVLAGCTVHPLQQDVTGMRTLEVVNYIRCETRLAIQNKAIDSLREYSQDERTAYLADELSKRRGQIWKVNPNRDLADAKERAFYFRYIQTGIAYDFTFDITEDNLASGSADPIRLITNGTAGIGLSASGDFKRNNLRHFIVSETFKDLLENPTLVCGDDYRPASYTYPISGSIGMAELISTFVDLNELKPLASDKSTSKVFADTLTFTTTLMGSASPHVLLSAAGNRWGLASPANIVGSASRIDKHALIVGLSMDVPKGSVRTAGAAAVVPIAGSPKSALQKNNIASPAEQSALDALIQARVDAYLDRAKH
jgi:hypothetical protein